MNIKAHEKFRNRMKIDVALRGKICYNCKKKRANSPKLGKGKGLCKDCAYEKYGSTGWVGR